MTSWYRIKNEDNSVYYFKVGEKYQRLLIRKNSGLIGSQVCKSTGKPYDLSSDI